MLSTVEHVIYYSDRCVGQNLNKTVFSMFCYYVELQASIGRKLTIEHKLMKTGHSHMEVDTVHAAIEKAKRRTTANIEIPHDWALFISAITRFFVTGTLCQKKTPEGEMVRFKDIMVFRYSTDAPGKVSYKYDPGQDFFETVHLLHQTAKVENITLHPLNTEPLTLPDAKLNDLRGLLPYICKQDYYKTFLKKLVPTKRGRKAKSIKEDNFEDDMDAEVAEEEIPLD
ncbi:uncharacterized protein LOC129718822 [Wyeomyia smithii]|uniref:uncharacterized protein LOC129718822 n=1 Tax=Wyeomyia smithii TaxID=174621 RepID=UPI002467F205|nr:uncharacterized protein LOC129718822 [Wyeomyia smithii]